MQRTRGQGAGVGVAVGWGEVEVAPNYRFRTTLLKAESKRIILVVFKPTFTFYRSSKSKVAELLMPHARFSNSEYAVHSQKL